MIDQIENFMNTLTDMDWGWWPVLSLRPTKDKDIDNVIVLKMTLIYGSIAGALSALLISLLSGGITLGVLSFAFPLAWLLFFIGYKVTVVYFWNRRARRLRSE